MLISFCVILGPGFDVGKTAIFGTAFSILLCQISLGASEPSGDKGVQIAALLGGRGGGKGGEGGHR